jgi:hypothetical protein
MLPPQRSSRSRVCLTTSTVRRLRNASVPWRQHRLRMPCQQFDEITPECHVNQRSTEPNLTRGSRRACIAYFLFPKRVEAGLLMMICLVQTQEYSANKQTATQLDGDKHGRPKRRPGLVTNKLRH